MRGNSPGKTGGFSLLEVLIALVLAGTVLTILASSFIQSAFTQQKIGGRITAAIIGAGKLAELEQGSELSLSGDFLPPYQDYNWFASEETAPDESIILTLIVEWKDGGSGKNVHQIFLKGFRPAKK
jgi:prepilin-type N-terminal cleavage/methylation domain-containing protein